MLMVCIKSGCARLFVRLVGFVMKPTFVMFVSTCYHVHIVSVIFEVYYTEGNTLLSSQINFIGWICYAEKTHGSYILPYIRYILHNVSLITAHSIVSSTKSPQQIIGSIVKDHLSSLLDKKYVVYLVYLLINIV